MEGMLKAMEDRPGSPKRFLERTLKLLEKATRVEALALADAYGEVLINSGKRLHAFSKSHPPQMLQWNRSEGLAQLWIELEIEAFNGSEVGLPFFPNDNKEKKWLNHSRLREERERERPRDRFMMEKKRRFRDDKLKPPSHKVPKNDDLYEFLVLDIPVVGHIKNLRNDLQMRVLIALTSFVALFAIVWVMRRQEHFLMVQGKLKEQEQLHKGLEEKNLAALGLAHETRTPLGVLRGHAQLNIDDAQVSDDVRDRSLIIVDEVDRITSRLNDFLDYARQPSPEFVVHDLRVLVDKVLGLLNLDLEDKAMKVKVEVENLQVKVDGDMMIQVLFNLMMNAVQILPEGGKIALFSKAKGERVDLHVIDNGPGFPEDLGDTCFQPYVTQREGGTGLGLAVVQQILSAHGASLKLLPSKKGAHLLIRGLRGVKA